MRYCILLLLLKYFVFAKLFLLSLSLYFEGFPWILCQKETYNSDASQWRANNVSCQHWLLCDASFFWEN